MNVCKFSAAAQKDLFDIYEYISLDDEPTAFVVVAEIERICKVIATLPRMGRERSDLRPGLRLFSVGRYVIAYRLIPDGVEIFRVIHGRRNLREIFDPDSN